MSDTFKTNCCEENALEAISWDPRTWSVDMVSGLSVLGVIAVGGSFMFEETRMIGETFSTYFRQMWVPILLGLVVGGIIECYLPKAYVEYYLARRKKRTILYALGLGLLMSVCSHGVLAIAMALYKKKASVPAIMTFLLAAPWASLPITILLIGFFGIKAFWIMGVALVVALVSGFIFQWLDHYQLITHREPEIEDTTFSIGTDIKNRWRQYQVTVTQLKKDFQEILTGILSLSKMVVGWLVIGMVLAAVSAWAIPHHWFSSYLGPSLSGLSYTLLLATVIEICSEGTSPLAFELYQQTGAFGNVVVFLLAGVATDYTEIGLIWKTIGWRSAVALPIITVPQIMVWGYLLN